MKFFIMIALTLVLGSPTLAQVVDREHNRMLVFQRGGRVVEGYGISAADTLLWIDTGKAVRIPRKGIEKVEILQTPDTRVTGWCVGALTGQVMSEAFRPWGQSSGFISKSYDKTSNTTSYLVSATVAGAFMGEIAYLIDNEFRPDVPTNRVFRAASDEDWQTLWRELEGRPARWQPQIEVYSGFVFGSAASDQEQYATRNGMTRGIGLSPFRIVEDAESSFNALRRIALTVPVLHVDDDERTTVRAGASFALIGQPAAIWSKEDRYLSDTEFSIANQASAYYAIGEIDRHLGDRRYGYDLSLTLGAGVADQNLVRAYFASGGPRSGDVTLRYWNSATRISALAAVSATLHVAADISVGGYLDYATLPTITMAPFPELGIPETRENFSNLSAGLTAQFRF